LVRPFTVSDVVAIGGPNVVPAEDDWFAQCVARSPGAPAHVLFDDRLAEHVPGCNFAVRRTALSAIGGFDPIFLRAGDDVDVCWRLQEAGGRIGFAPSALVWHHHRARLSSYWHQQVGYGEGEAWLRFRHARRFSGLRIAWRGRIYSALPFVRSLSISRLHSGVWGGAAFPSVYNITAHPLRLLPLTPEWQWSALLVLLGGLLLGSVGMSLGSSLAIAGALALGLTFFRCTQCALRTDIDDLPAIRSSGPRLSRLMYRTVIAALHIVQPTARAYGYVRGRLRPPMAATAQIVSTPHSPEGQFRTDGPGRLKLLASAAGHCSFWSETWISVDELLARIVDRLRLARLGREIRVDDGWQPDRDVSVSLGIWAWAHLKTVVEEHERGRCLFRARVHIRPKAGSLAIVALFLGSACIAAGVGDAEFAGVVVVCAVVTLGVLGCVVSRDAGQIFDVVAEVASECGMLRMRKTERRRRPRVWRHRDLVRAVHEHANSLIRGTVGD
jgi:hypothetical protein